MKVSFQTFELEKRFALTISRGTSSGSTNIWLRVEADGIEGWGEAAAFSWYGIHQTTDVTLSHLKNLQPKLEAFHPLERERIHALLDEQQVPSVTRAIVDLALHDWLGKATQLPLWKLWGLEPETTPQTSVTVGINEPEKVKERVRDWLEHAPGCTLKVKLGSPQGIQFDQSIIRAVLDTAPTADVRVDANGGWNVKDALAMCYWLDERGVLSVEQPLARGEEDKLPTLYENSPLPIFADESCFDRADIIALADRVHGVNIKLMKCGGLTEAIRMIHTAQACGLHVMFGCFSESALAIQAAVQLSPLAYTVDLDSHLNMKNWPFQGDPLTHGRILPGERPGLGVVAGSDPILTPSS
ncbi:MAG: dipeptide epimerase [Deltaproteobacteria bacterium]|nr:MAG: dipeptide epimerase [Deltaproteobacteria bacterium]